MADPTRYVVLHRWVPPSSPADSANGISGALAQIKLPAELWVPVAEVDAQRREDAVDAYVQDATDLPEGDHEFRAVAKSGWPEETIPYTIATKRVVEKRKVASAVA